MSKLEINAPNQTTKGMKVLIDGVDLTERIGSLTLNFEAGRLNQAVIYVFPEQVDVEADVEVTTA